MKHRGVKIVTRKVTRYEVQTVDGRKLKTFASAGKARSWIDGYVKAVRDLAPRSAEPEERTR
jgi:hypothetical protein